MAPQQPVLRWFLGLALLCVGLLSAGLARADGTGAHGQVVLLDVQGAIGPAVADYLRRGIDRAEREGARLVILRMDTPGGLDSAMRDIVKRVVAARVPVATYVAPAGARAASAGTYILLASHLAAMAPATTLGAATPVHLEGPGLGAPARNKPEAAGAPRDPGQRKALEDSAAYIRGLAAMHGRNVEWAERAVTEAASLSAEEALAERVTDLLAGDLDALLRAADGRTVRVQGKPVVLATAGAQVVAIEPDWRSRLLAVITDPNIAYLLLLLGMYGLFFELSNPGSILPGVAGAISLLLALYAFQVLPINYAGLTLMGVGIAFMVAEVFVPSFGALGVGGVLAFIVGSVILMDAEGGAPRVSVPLVVGFGLASAAFFMLVATMAARSRRRPVVSGAEELPGSIGEVLRVSRAGVQVRVRGEVWQAHGPQGLLAGQRVRVVARDGLFLRVEPWSEEV